MVTRFPTCTPLVPLSEFHCMSDFLRASEEDSLSVRGPCLDFSGRLERSRAERCSSGPYVLGVVEQKDLLDVSVFIVRCFGADAMHLSSSLSPIERAVISRVVKMLNGVSTLLAATELYQGLRIRTRCNRNSALFLDHPAVDDVVSDPDAQLKLASQSSVVLALAKRESKRGSLLDVVAAVELRLQPCDAKIPFALPILDSFERKIGSMFGVSPVDNANITMQPYLCNLCVDERLRGQGVGRVLLRAVETIGRHWGYSNVYLHVDEENAVAYQLYTSEGYRDVQRRWRPFWAGRAAEVSYLVKDV